MTVLATARLTLRWLEPRDAAFVLELQSEPVWRRYIGERGVASLESAQEYIDAVRSTSYLRHGFGLYAMEPKAGGVPVGLCGLIKRQSLPEVDLGFALLARHCGQGLALEAATAVLQFARSQLQLSRVAAITRPENERSIRLLERLGMGFDRTLQLPGEAQLLRLYLTPVAA